MGRFWLGIGLLAAFLALGLWVSTEATDAHTSIAQILEQATEKTLAGDFSAGKALAQKAARQWEKSWHGTASIADHDPMDEIDGLFAQLDIYSKADRPTAFAACCARLAKLVSAVGEAHSLNWWNLL